MQIMLFVLACSQSDTTGTTDSATVVTVPWTTDTGIDDTGGSDSADVDLDNDGWDFGEDCDDSRADVHPGAQEVCNGVDDDCNAAVDDGLPVATVYVDADGDGYGNLAGYDACDVPPGSTTISGDCDDASSQVHPGATDVCNDHVDSDCDGDPEPGCALPAYDLIADAAWSAAGEGPGHGFGTFLTVGGDLDADGWNDVVVGAPGATALLGTHLAQGGAVYAFFDRLSDPYEEAVDASVSYYADNTSDLDYGATFAGDIDGDGYDDLAVGAPGLDANDGAVQLFFGPLRSGDRFWSGLPQDAFATSDPGSHLGTSIVAAGDLDGDGNGDVVVGAARANTVTASAAGAAYVLSGPVTGSTDVTTAAVASVYGNESGGGYYSEVVAGDLDADGISDLVVSFPWMTSQGLADAGVVAVHQGPLSGAQTIAFADVTIEGVEQSGQLGWSSIVAPDQDGDGYGELVVGADSVRGGKLSGGVYLWNGDFAGGRLLEPASADVTWVGAPPTERTGSAVATGDVNGDGVPDFLIGAPDVSGSSSPGSAYVDYGPVSGVTVVDSTAARFRGDNGDRSGFAIAAGDVNADGYDDFFVGAPGYDDVSGADVGRAYLWLGLGF